MRSQDTDWGKIVTMYISNKRIVSRIYKNILKLKITTQLNLKLGKKNVNRFFTEDIWIAINTWKDAHNDIWNEKEYKNKILLNIYLNG